MTEILGNSSLIFSEDDIYVNIKKFRKTKNICFITGQSGSGKSTLAKLIMNTFHAKLVSLDVIDYKLFCGKIYSWDDLKLKCEVLYEYMRSTKKSLYYNTNVSKEIKEQNTIDFVEWISKQEGYFVVEGIQVCNVLLTQTKYRTYPVIFKGTSHLLSYIRACCREKSFKRLNFFKWYPYYREWKTMIDRTRKLVLTEDNYVCVNENDIKRIKF